MGIERRNEAGYQACARKLANWYLDGNDEWFDKMLPHWAEKCYEVTVEEMMADVNSWIARMHDSDKGKLASLKSLKAKGRKTYYEFPYGIAPIGEAIARVEARLARY
jgi:hypothetical protein